MKFTSALVLFLVLTTTTLAQSPNKILSQAAKSLGGEKALRSITSSTHTGTITRISDNATGSYRAETSTGNLYTVTFDIAVLETATGYNGKSGWIKDSKDGLRTITGEAARDFQAESSYRNSRWLNAKSEKTKIASAGTATIDGKTANVVTLTTAKGSQIKLYFDAATGLLLREDIPVGSEVKTFQYADYRKVNNIQTPFLIKMNNGGETYEIKLDSVSYNQPIAKKNFDFPTVSNEPLPDITALLNETRANAEKIDRLLENYSFTELRVDREMSDKGELTEKSSEKRLLTFYKGYRINRLIEKNGKPLSPADQADEDKDVQKQVAEIEKKSPHAKRSKTKRSSPESPGSLRTKTNVSRSPMLLRARCSSILAASSFAAATSSSSTTSQTRLSSPSRAWKSSSHSAPAPSLSTSPPNRSSASTPRSPKVPATLSRKPNAEPRSA